MQPIYVPGTSFLHRLHPLTKLCMVLLFLVATYTLPPFIGPLLVALLVLILAWSAGAFGSLLRAALLILAPIALSLVLIQGLLFPPTKTLPIALGPITIWRDGLEFAGSTIIRIFALIASTMLLLKTTHPADLVSALAARGLPASVGYMVLVALQLVPDMSARAAAILEVQQSRGLEVRGMIRRSKALVPLVSPLIIGALADVEDRAMALESRAFTAIGPKTTLHLLVDTTMQRVARAALLLVTVGLIVARFTVLRDVV